MFKLDLIMTPTAPGELVDKITVLKIKEERIDNPDRLQNIKCELGMLLETMAKYFPKAGPLSEEISELESRLKKLNEEIWDMSDKIRELGNMRKFDDEFIRVAYGVHLSNDKRAATKKQINLLLGSDIIEEKSYVDWK